MRSKTYVHQWQSSHWFLPWWPENPKNEIFIPWIKNIKERNKHIWKILQAAAEEEEEEKYQQLDNELCRKNLPHPMLQPTRQETAFP